MKLKTKKEKQKMYFKKIKEKRKGKKNEKKYFTKTFKLKKE